MKEQHMFRKKNNTDLIRVDRAEHYASWGYINGVPYAVETWKEHATASKWMGVLLDDLLLLDPKLKRMGKTRQALVGGHEFVWALDEIHASANLLRADQEEAAARKQLAKFTGAE
jgi:hypothetical protein